MQPALSSDPCHKRVLAMIDHFEQMCYDVPKLRPPIMSVTGRHVSQPRSIPLFEKQVPVVREVWRQRACCGNEAAPGWPYGSSHDVVSLRVRVLAKIFEERTSDNKLGASTVQRYVKEIQEEREDGS